MDFEEKFEIEYSPIQTSKYVIYVSENSTNFSAFLKDGKKLVDRNKQLFLKTHKLLWRNYISVQLFLVSLLSFIAFIFYITNPLLLPTFRSKFS